MLVIYRLWFYKSFSLVCGLFIPIRMGCQSIYKQNSNFEVKTEQPIDKVIGEERPLGEKLPDGFEVKLSGFTHKLAGAIQLHRAVLQSNQNYNLEKRKDEITSTIIDSVCSLASEADPNMPDLPDDDDIYDDMYDDYEINGRKEDQIKEVNTNHIFITFDEQLDGTGVQFMYTRLIGNTRT